MSFSDLKPLTAKYVYQLWQKNGMKLVSYLISFMKFYPNFQTNCYLFVIQGKKKLLKIDYTYWSPLFDTSLYFEKGRGPVCVACGAVITVKHILIECADLLEIRKKYFEERSLYSLFRNAIPEIIFDFLREIGVSYKV